MHILDNNCLSLVWGAVSSVSAVHGEVSASPEMILFTNTWALRQHSCQQTQVPYSFEGFQYGLYLILNTCTSYKQSSGVLVNVMFYRLHLPP